MKILVLQLARFGDILQTVPVLNALRRQHPEAEIDFMVRHRFQEAGQFADSMDSLVVFPSEDLLEPMIVDENCCGLSLKLLDQRLQDWKSKGYDRIINLSFSPLSSYLVDAIAGPNCEVAGYKRHNDGYLDFSDDVSAYFYAQVGIGKANRAHITEIFSEVAQAPLDPEDFRFILKGSNEERLRFKQEKIKSGKYILLHIGASQSFKSLGVLKWKQLIRRLSESYEGKLVLVGSKEESEKAMSILAEEQFLNTVNLVGETNLDQLMYLCQQAELIVGGDSLLMNMGTLTGTACFNISFEGVNFWETGPISQKSRILFCKKEFDLSAEHLAQEIMLTLSDEPSRRGAYLVKEAGTLDPVKYESVPNVVSQGDFCWNLIQAMYLGDPYPVSDSLEFVTAVKRLYEVIAVGVGQVESIRNALGKKEPLSATVSSNLLDEVDQVIHAIYQLNLEIRPIIDWFQTQRVKIKPGPMESILQETQKAYEDLKMVLKVYLIEEDWEVQSKEMR